jgi:hypothetical protein
VNKLLILQIDGLSSQVLDFAVGNGYMPFVKKMLQKEWQKKEVFCGLPASTPAAQMSMFYGISNLVLGFRFLLKKDKMMFMPNISGSLKKMEEIADKINDKPLMENGVPILSILPGGSPRGLSLALRHSKSKKDLHKLCLFLLNPINFFYLLLKIIVMFVVEEVEYRKNIRKTKLPMNHFYYLFRRIGEELLMGEFSLVLTKKAIANKEPVIYVNFFGYDEIAHYYDVENKLALHYLSIVDLYLKKLFAAVQRSESDYEIVILSDHGMASSVPFSEINSCTLGEKIENLYHGKKIVEQMEGKKEEDYSDKTDLYVLNSGGLSLIYDGKSQKKLNKDELEKRYPDFCDRVSSFEGVGFLLTSDREGKAMVVKNGKKYFLGEEKSVVFLPHTTEEVRKKIVDQLYKLFKAPYAADVYVFGEVLNPNRVVSFEDQAACHGGLGGWQNFSFLISRKIKIDSKDMNDLGSLYHYFYQYLYS